MRFVLRAVEVFEEANSPAPTLASAAVYAELGHEGAGEVRELLASLDQVCTDICGVAQK
jgi:hypothetical protein